MCGSGGGAGLPSKVLKGVKGNADGVVHREVDEVAHLLEPLVLDGDRHLRSIVNDDDTLGRGSIGVARVGCPSKARCQSIVGVLTHRRIHEQVSEGGALVLHALVLHSLRQHVTRLPTAHVHTKKKAAARRTG